MFFFFITSYRTGLVPSCYLLSYWLKFVRELTQKTYFVLPSIALLSARCPTLKKKSLSFSQNLTSPTGSVSPSPEQSPLWETVSLISFGNVCFKPVTPWTPLKTGLWIQLAHYCTFCCFNLVSLISFPSCMWVRKPNMDVTFLLPNDFFISASTPTSSLRKWCYHSRRFINIQVKKMNRTCFHGFDVSFLHFW